MATENASYIEGLDPARPGSGEVVEGDEHHNMVKQVLKNQFAGEAGDLYDEPVTVGPVKLNGFDARIAAVEGDYVSQATPQTITADHLLQAGATLANNANLEGRNAADDADLNVAAVDTADQVQIGDVTAAGLLLNGPDDKVLVPYGVGQGVVLHSANLDTQKALFVNLIFPVGSIYLTIGNTNPGTLLGVGTWSQIAEGRFLAGVGTGTDKNAAQRTYPAGDDTFGEYEHTLTASEMPAHSHQRGNSLTTEAVATGAGTGDLHILGDTQSAGGDAAHENSPPAFGAYIWQRTA